MTHNDPAEFSLRHPVAHARGLGSAKEGSHHWWVQRVTSVILIPVTFWLISTVIFMIGQPYDVVRVWFGNLFVATLLLLSLYAMFYHSILGVQVILEDYVDHEGWRMALLYFFKTILVVTGAITMFCVLRMGLGF